MDRLRLTTHTRLFQSPIRRGDRGNLSNSLQIAIMNLISVPYSSGRPWQQSTGSLVRVVHPLISVPYSSGRPWQPRTATSRVLRSLGFQSPIRRGDRGNMARPLDDYSYSDNFSPLFVGATVATPPWPPTPPTASIISVPYSSGRPWQPPWAAASKMPFLPSPARRIASQGSPTRRIRHSSDLLYGVASQRPQLRRGRQGLRAFQPPILARFRQKEKVQCEITSLLIGVCEDPPHNALHSLFLTGGRTFAARTGAECITTPH